MKFCIISDLHCKYKTIIDQGSESILFSNMPRKPATQHPVVSMLQIIDDYEELQDCEVLLCLGDLGDKADEQGITSAWVFIEEIKQKLKAKVKLGIPGNHDVNSRGNNGKSPFEYITAFHEDFPTDSPELNNRFWQMGYCIYIYNNTLILLINTVMSHVNGEAAALSSIKITALNEIEKELKNHELLEIKLCILHHHPIKHSNINYNDTDSLEKGDELIDLLNKYNFNVIIHGHKHQPRIVEYNGLPIFATGSFSSFANLQGSGFNTMFHVIDINEKNKCGKIHSWEYNVKNGWQKRLNENFPPLIGFGSKLNVEETAENIYKIFKKTDKPIMYSQVTNEYPDILYMIPENLIQLGKILNKKYNLNLSPNYPLQPDIIIPL